MTSAAWLAAGILCQGANGADTPSQVQIFEQQPVSLTRLSADTTLIDFGRTAFGNLLLLPPPKASGPIVVRFGESLRGGQINRTPPGSVRYYEVHVTLAGTKLLVAPPADWRNTRPPAVLTPKEWGVLTPFRWVEIEGWPGELHASEVRRRVAMDSTWNEAAASFHSSDPTLDRIWALSHYTIGAATFAGVFVDGDRERIAYEADAYLTQLSYYAGDPDPRMVRATFEHLVRHPTWPTEWAPHMIFIAYADWMQTGDREWLAEHYEWLKSRTLTERSGSDGLIHSTAAQMKRGDITDWPAGERDGFVFTPENTVVNAFHLRAIELMRRLALALGKQGDANGFAERERSALAAFQRTLFNPATGLYRDGIGTDHSSLHANLFPLAFGLVPQEDRDHVAAWLAARGMKASPYAAQYLLEGLFENGEAKAAIDEITAPGDRSWKHMLDSGTTMTWEAWDMRYKPNQDWNHAWGAAPANLLPRFVLGVQPSEPGWKQAAIEPHPGGLAFASGTLPTPRGDIRIEWTAAPRFTLSVRLPAGMTATLRVPAPADSHEVRLNGRTVAAHRDGDVWAIDEIVRDKVTVEVR